MKTKFALMTALLAFSYAFSQEINPKLKVYSQKVDSIVFSEKSKMNKELDDLERSYLDNKITADEKREKKTEIAERYEEIINGKVTAEKDQLETATREMVKDAVMGDPKKQSLQLLAQNNAVLVLNTGIKKTKKELLKTFDFNIGYGFINLTKSSSSLDIGNNESGIRSSLSSQMDIRMTRQIGSLVSPVFYRLGLGYRQDTFNPEKPNVFVQDLNEIYLADFNDLTTGTLKKSYFRNHYFVVPADIVWVLNPKYTIENNEKMLDNSRTNLRLTAGIYGGVRFLTQNYVIFKNEDNNRVKYRENVQEAAERFIFGGKLAVGYGPINIYIKKDFTPNFNDLAKINNKYGFQIGLELLYINF
ncbi:hypothetical protein [uncultured Chryseobacterium sp.]|uniref:hypothetical protein n=1 Tax=uncultured Chryseobacterium sp. TaxID=259322 RepID=UPI0025FD56F1|nr:hypothetical protein [uncultured Chryseobacterium sp.]